MKTSHLNFENLGSIFAISQHTNGHILLTFKLVEHSQQIFQPVSSFIFYVNWLVEDHIIGPTQSGRFMDFQIWNVKNLMQIPDSIKLLDCIVWNIILNINCGNNNPRHYRLSSKETPFYCILGLLKGNRVIFVFA